MKKKLLYLGIILMIFLLVGCGKKTKNVEISRGPSCKSNDLELITVLDSDNQLTNYITIPSYHFENKSEFQTACDSYKTLAEDNNRNHSYVTFKAICDKQDYTVSLEQDYNIEKSLEVEEAKDDIFFVLEFVKEDGAFDLDGWFDVQSRTGAICSR